MTINSPGAHSEHETFSLVDGDVLARVMARLGLMSPRQPRLARRAILFALVAWLPVAIWAIIHKTALAGTVDEPLFEHFGIHVRGLIAIPLLVIAEASVRKTMPPMLGYFCTSGLVTQADEARFASILTDVRRVRDRSLPWVIIAGVVVAWVLSGTVKHEFHELRWAEEPGGSIGFGGWWYMLVTRPIFVTLALAWLWRLALLGILFARIGKLPLALVPTHPDHAGGLRFVERFASMFSLVILALSSVVAAEWAHQVQYHALEVTTLKIDAALLIVIVAGTFLLPYLFFLPRMAAVRKEAEFNYANLVGQQGRLVHARWIEGREVKDTRLFEAGELGPVADTATIYELVRKMGFIPIGKRALVATLAPILVPVIVVVSMQVPLKGVLIKLLGALA